MAVSKEEIRAWLKEGQDRKATHVVIVCDTYDWDDYPVFVESGQDPKIIADTYRHMSMQKVMEVYSLTGKYDIESQLRDHLVERYD